MSLTHKKYWLDGIFEEDLLTSLVNDRGLSSTSCVPDTSISIPLNEEVGEKEIFAQWWSSEEILCREFIHCDNARCGKRHYYRRRYETRLLERDFAKKYAYSPEFLKDETRETLNRVIIRLAGDGVRAIVK